MRGADTTKVRGDLNELPPMGVKFPSRHMNFFRWCYGGFKDRLPGFLICDLQPGQIGKESRRGVTCVESEASAVVECPTIATKVRNMVAASVVQIDGEQDPVMLWAEFKDELFLALNTEDAVRVSKNVGTEADFQTVFAPLRF